MQFLVNFTPKERFKVDGVPADFLEQELLEQAQTRVLYAAGGLRQVWAKVPKTRGAVTLFEAESPEHLQTMIDSFPLITKDYADFEITALQPHESFMPSSGEKPS